VRWELPKTVRQRTASSGCPEPPHPEERACGSAAANQVARARVSKDGAAVTPSCFETHRSGRRPRKAPALASRCDAPQHEGEGRRAFWRNEPNRHFGRTKPSGELGVFGPSEAPTFGCRKRPRAQFHCFRPVLYNDFCNSHVSAALSAQDFPKATFAQTWPWSRRHIRPGPTGRPSRAARRRLIARPCVGAYPRMLVMKVAPLLRRQRKSSQQVVRSSFAFRAGGWLRLSRPTQSLMTLA